MPTLLTQNYGSISRKENYYQAEKQPKIPATTKAWAQFQPQKTRHY